MSDYAKKVEIRWSLNPSAYEVANKQYTNTFPRHLGSTKKANVALMENYDEMKMVLRHVISINPESSSSNWDKEVKYYFDSFDVTIDETGFPLNIGFKYDIHDTSRKHYIDELKDKVKSGDKHIITDGQTLGDYVEGTKSGEPNVPFNEKYKYGKPINPEHYIIYRYALAHYRVANDPRDIAKSREIWFYIHDEGLVKNRAKASMNEKNKAKRVYLNIIADKEKMDNMILSLGGDLANFPEDVDKCMWLETMSNTNIQKFLDTSEDTNLNIKATIYRLINADILTKHENGAIVHTLDPSKIIGNNLSEAITFFGNPANEAKVAKLRNSLKASNVI